MKIVNLGQEDYHMHSFNFSDWMNTVDEIVQHANKIWLKKIAITDHSQVVADTHQWLNKWRRRIIERWQNVHNDVEVIFGVEWDLLNEAGDVCLDIQWKIPEFVLLSAHSGMYQWNPENITQAYINAIKRYHDKIKFLGHPCVKTWEKYIDIETITKVANEYWVWLEFNCKNFVTEKTNMDNLEKMLSIADTIYVNSDAHTLYELQTYRPIWLEYIKKFV